MKDRDTDRDWNLIAAQEPHWGVLSDDQFKKINIDDAKLDSFMLSGEEYIASLFLQIDSFFAIDFKPERALDFGCGVGRLTIPLAKRAKEVVAVDIAPDMLSLCRQYAKNFNLLEKIISCESDDTLSKVEGEFDLINSSIVLQHIPPHRGYQIIQALLSKLIIGGIGSIQLTYAKSRKFLIHEQSGAMYYRRDGDVLTDLVETNYAPPVGHISMYDYDLNNVMAIITRVCRQPLLIRPTNDDSHLGVNLIFRKDIK